MRILLPLLAGVLAGLLAAPGSSASEAPRVAASIKPVHGIAAAVMAGVGEPELLIAGAASPHSYALKPSDARMLRKADAVFWVGEELETVLAKPIAALAKEARVVALAHVPGVRTLPAREGGVWEGDGHDAAGTDGHIWLDPENGKAMARAMAEALGAIDPANAARYAANAGDFAKRADALAEEIAAELAPVRDAPYLVFHDGYQYFEARFGLSPLGAIAVAPDRPIPPNRVLELRTRIRDGGVACVFAEPQFPPKLIGVLVEGTKTRTATLDPMGAAVPAGPELYFTVLRDLSHALASCLGPAPRPGPSTGP